MKNKFLLSIIVPVYNETSRLHNLASIHKYFDEQSFPFELIVVDDGSTDSTLKQLKTMEKKLKLKIFSYPKNHGKGYAIKTGMKAASGDFLLFTDVDLSTPLDQFQNFLPFLDKFDVIIGTRKNSQAKLIKRQPILRELLGKFFTFISQKTLSVDVSDFTCGFKCFSKRAAKEIFSRALIERWGFDSEILFLAKKKHFKLKEVSVSWKNDPNSKVRFPQDIIRSLQELYLIRKNDFKKLYK